LMVGPKKTALADCCHHPACFMSASMMILCKKTNKIDEAV